MPGDDDQPPIRDRGYTRTRRPRPITFTCQGCAAVVTEERLPGPTPRYCQPCSADPDLVRQRARERKAAQRRHRQEPGTSTADCGTLEQSDGVTAGDVTELAGAVTEPPPSTKVGVAAAAVIPEPEELVVSVFVPGQREPAHVTVGARQMPPAPDCEPPEQTPAVDPPPDAHAAPSTPRPTRRVRPAPKPLVVHVRHGQTHWLAENARTLCGRRVSATASVTQRGWASCDACARRWVRISAPGSTGSANPATYADDG